MHVCVLNWYVAFLVVLKSRQCCSIHLEDLIVLFDARRGHQHHHTYINSTAPAQFRIVGGNPLPVHDVPYLVSVKDNEGNHCGGNILNETVILTAAHCLFKVTSPKLIHVRAGTSDLNVGGYVRSVHKFIIHKDFNATSMDCDIALVFLNIPLKFSERISSVEIPEQDEDLPVGKNGTVSGWGKLHESDVNLSRVMRSIQLPIIDEEYCRNLYSRAGQIITRRMFCAGEIGEGVKDVCDGDSGGPFVVGGKLVGIVSWGAQCADKLLPTVFTRVAPFRYWLMLYTDFILPKTFHEIWDDR